MASMETLSASTRKAYLIEPRYSGTTRIIDCVPGERPIVRLEETIFHPQGGGQKADRGTIGPSKVLHVSHNGAVVDHYVDSLEGLVVGQEYPIEVDATWRKLNSVYHTAGHLIASAVEGLQPGLSAVAGHQWPGEARVEFIPATEGAMPALMSVEEIQAAVSRSLEEGLEVRIDGDPFTARQIVIGEFKGIPCGGTHVPSLREISEIRITQVKAKAGKIRVSYEAVPA